MAVRSIIDIDVADGKFRQFTESYAKYEKALGAQAGMWAKAGTEQSKIASNFQKIAASALAQNKVSSESTEAGKKQLAANRENSRLWTSMQRSTKDVSTNIKDATTSLLRWTGLLGAVTGLLGAGGLYGIDRMASSVANDRVSARRRGVTIGQQSAFKNFERYGVDSSFLDTVSELESDPSHSVFARMGISGGGSTEENSIALLRQMRLRAQAMKGQEGLLDAQTGMKFGSNNWKALASGTDEEFNKTLAANERDSKALGVNDKTAEAWTDFNRQMQRAGQQLENVFVKGLVRLEPALERVSGAFIKIVETIMGSKGMDDGIKTLAKWLDEFAAAVSDGSFQKNVRDFIDGVGDLAHAVAHPIDSAIGNPATAGKPATGLTGFFASQKERQDNTRNAFKSFFSEKTYDNRLGLPEGTIADLAGPAPNGKDDSEEYKAKKRAIFSELEGYENRAEGTGQNAQRAALQQYQVHHPDVHIFVTVPTGSDVNAQVNSMNVATQ
jgi:hypothetical protein